MPKNSRLVYYVIYRLESGEVICLDYFSRAERLKGLSLDSVVYWYFGTRELILEN